MKRFKKARDIKVGVVGYGVAFGTGRGHLKAVREAGMTPVAVADSDPGRVEAVREDFPDIETYHSLGAMLRRSDVNLVVIATPHNTHARLGVQALNAGRHVVCEKPLATTTAGCDAMIAAAARNKVVLSAFHNRHWDGCIMRAVKVVRSGAIGEIVRIEAHMGKWAPPRDWWRSSRSISGGILYDWGAHLIEYSLQLIDSEIAEVSGFAKRGFWAPKTAWKDDTNEDEAFAVVRFAGGQWLTLCISQIDSRPKYGVLEITGTKGTYLFNHREWELTRRKGKAPVVAKGSNPPHQRRRLYRNVADHLVKGTELVITGELARRCVHVLDLAGRSAVKGRALKAKYP